MAGKYDVTDFDKEVIEKSQIIPIVVDFWAEWCGPCLMLAPIIESLAEENTAKWILAKINTDERKDLAAQYNILGIPAIRIFYKGMVTAEFNGLMYKPQFARWLEDNVPKISA
ncbi:MAG: thioredoxin domain-containing protein [Bacteroidota bacterium]|nr:thioredoxin domain-containing protein [Bacteroidota bacterium]